MKPVDFGYVRPTSLREALEALATDPNAKIIAGGQTLGPMLNLRLAQPTMLIDLTRIEALGRVDADASAVSFGAVVTHAAIEDGRTPDPANGYMRRLAAGIGYRAVRVRGTIGGSLAHADPAADWMCGLSLLGAEVTLASLSGTRNVPVSGFMRGALETVLQPGEILTAVKVPKVSARARLGYHKFCRKEGEFAEAIAAVAQDPERGIFRAVVSTPSGAPVVFDSAIPFDSEKIAQLLQDAALPGDAYDIRLRHTVLKRALNEARL